MGIRARCARRHTAPPRVRLGFFAIGSALWLLYGGLLSLEKILDWNEESNEAKRVANLLRNSHAAGHRAVTVVALVDLWLDVQPDNRVVRFAKRNYRLRVLKDAIEQRLLRADLLGDSFASQRSKVEIASAIEFFQKRRWHHVKPRQTGVVYGDEKMGGE